jgi:hypothetical protein
MNDAMLAGMAELLAIIEDREPAAGAAGGASS